MENYMPIEALKRSGVNNEFIAIYEKLSDDIQDFYDLEKGLKNTSIDKLPSGVRDLFADVSDEDYKYLNRNVFIKDKFKSTFPDCFRFADRESLLERTKNQKDPDELVNILLKISKAIQNG